jgi:hypothetical protein
MGLLDWWIRNAPGGIGETAHAVFRTLVVFHRANPSATVWHLMTVALAFRYQQIALLTPDQQAEVLATQREFLPHYRTLFGRTCTNHEVLGNFIYKLYMMENPKVATTVRAGDKSAKWLRDELSTKLGEVLTAAISRETDELRRFLAAQCPDPPDPAQSQG